MPRIYNASAKELNVAAGLELFSLKMTGTAAQARIRRLVLSMVQSVIPQAQGLEFKIIRLSAPTQVTSGTLVTPSKQDTGDSASLATVYVNNATLSTGTPNYEWDDGCYFYTGRDLVFDGELLVPSGQLLQVILPNAPAGVPTPALNAMLEWDERGA